MTALGHMTVPMTDHVEQARAKLVQKYRDKPRFLALLDSFIKQIQELENAIDQVIRSRFLDEADDFHTELLGKLVGQPRRGEDLATYKLYISARILVNRSLARAADIIQIANVLLRADEPDEFVLYDEGACHITLTAPDELDPDADPEVLVEMVRQAKAAGVGLLFIYPTVPAANTFRYTSSSPTFNPSEGWGSTTESTGGKWSSVIDGRVTGYIP
jgi:hypothetical protein